MLTLHLSPGSVALASHMALEEAALPHALVWLDLGSGAQNGEAYRTVNPKGRVPALATPAGVLTETPAILEYIAAQAPGAGLAPQEAWGLARMREAMAWLASTVHVNHAHKARGNRWTDDAAAQAAMTAGVTKNMTANAGEMETLLGATGGPWLGVVLTLADLHLHTIARWLPADGVDLSAFPRLQRHMEAVAARPGAARAIAMHEAGGVSPP